MTEEENKKLNIELCELFQDIWDCLRTSNKFDELYYLIESTRNPVYQLREEHLDISTDYVYRITIIDENIIHFVISMASGYMSFTVDQELETAQQTVNDPDRNTDFKFSEGLRMNEHDICVLENVLDWCEKINPDYW